WTRPRSRRLTTSSRRDRTRRASGPGGWTRRPETGLPPAKRSPAMSNGPLGRWRRRRRYLGQHPSDEVVGVHPFGQGLVGEHEAVAQKVGGQAAHVFRQGKGE